MRNGLVFKALHNRVASASARPSSHFVKTRMLTLSILDQGVMSGIISAPAFTQRFPQVHDTNFEGFVVSIYAVGCFLGACFILNFGDWLGRRRAIYLGATVM